MHNHPGRAHAVRRPLRGVAHLMYLYLFFTKIIHLFSENRKSKIQLGTVTADSNRKDKNVMMF